MRPCDICGRDLGLDAAFAVCPACLLERALEEPERESEAFAPESAPSSLTPSALFPKRDFFGKYELLDALAHGGQGDLWKVRDIEFRRTLAMKRLNQRDAALKPALYRFLAEA